MLDTILPIAALIAALALPVAAIGTLLWLSKRRLDGRRGRLDGLLRGLRGAP